VIAILNTWSDINSCHSHFRQRAEEVKRGIWQAGGFPVEMPALSLAEPFQKPTTMLYRNLLALETEELLRSYPADGCVLMGGCDKTTPALVMGALSMNLPTIFLPAGPMLRGDYKGKYLGSGSDTWKYWAELRAGNITEDDWRDVEDGIARSPGHCMTMGTASTMTSATEAMGLTLSGAASIPAPDSRHAQMATLTGKRIVEMVWQDLKILDVVDKRSIDNAVTTALALGGSTNAIVHLIATARRAGVALDLERFDALARRTPVLANIRPSGKFLMEDFYYAGGVPAVMREIKHVLDGSALTVNGKTLGENFADAPNWNREVIKELDKPFRAHAGIAVLRGNLAPDGAVIKPSAASPHLLKHKGRAVVFESIEDFHARIDDENLDIDEHCIMVLKGCGPKGYPGMAEVGNMPLPPKLLRRGITDILRISDARMSGTAYGAVVLHVSPEAAAGGPLALVRNGDLIEVDVPARKLHLDVSDEELSRRRAAWKAPEAPKRGWYKLYVDHVQQAHLGADLDVLVGGSGSDVSRDSH